MPRTKKVVEETVKASENIEVKEAEKAEVAVEKKEKKARVAKPKTVKVEEEKPVVHLADGDDTGQVKGVEVVTEKVEEKEEVKEEKKVFASLAEEMFDAGAHFGHMVKKWNPKMAKYIWGEKSGIHIIDLEKTVALLETAQKELEKAASTKKRIILVGTKRQVKPLVEELAKKLGVAYITQRWLGGLITNWKQVKLTLDRLNSLKIKREKGELKKYTKKEQLEFDKEITRLERIVGGIAGLKDTPELVVVFDTQKERLTVKECRSRGVTIIGVCDTNANPDVLDFPIPMNDDSVKALEIVVRELGRSLEKGLKS